MSTQGYYPPAIVEIGPEFEERRKSLEKPVCDKYPYSINTKYLVYII